MKHRLRSLEKADLLQLHLVEMINRQHGLLAIAETHRIKRREEIL